MCGTGPLRKSRCRGHKQIDRGTLTRSGKSPCRWWRCCGWELAPFGSGNRREGLTETQSERHILRPLLRMWLVLVVVLVVCVPYLLSVSTCVQRCAAHLVAGPPLSGSGSLRRPFYTAVVEGNRAPAPSAVQSATFSPLCPILAVPSHPGFFRQRSPSVLPGRSGAVLVRARLAPPAAATPTSLVAARSSWLSRSPSTSSSWWGRSVPVCATLPLSSGWSPWARRLGILFPRKHLPVVGQVEPSMAWRPGSRCRCWAPPRSPRCRVLRVGPLHGALREKKRTSTCKNCKNRLNRCKLKSKFYAPRFQPLHLQPT